ncbi:DUF421 domain-containing protein [Candidatus Gracilibacteria bacterium]|nr:DUF421 domain-containing protein [Candidatus Gracilibacteria bacterium]
MIEVIKSVFQYFPNLLLAVVVGLVGLQLLLRIFGKRSLAKIDGIDFASTIAIGSVLATMMVSETTSVLRGISVIAIILATQSAILLMYKYVPSIKSIFANSPYMLIENGKILQSNLDSSNLTKENLMEQLRIAGVRHIHDVDACVFETTGDISVIKKSDQSSDLIDEELFSGVKR